MQQFGTPWEVYNTPDNLFVAGFMGSPAMSFVPVTVAQGEQGLEAEVRGNDGRIMKLPVPEYLADRVGREVILGIRPEHITQPQDQKNDQALVTTGHFTIEVTEPTGPDVIALIQLNDTNVHCRIDPEHPVTWGETAELMFDMKKVVFFDPGTEKRIVPH